MSGLPCSLYKGWTKNYIHSTNEKVEGRVKDTKFTFLQNTFAKQILFVFIEYTLVLCFYILKKKLFFFFFYIVLIPTLLSVPIFTEDGSPL